MVPANLLGQQLKEVSKILTPALIAKNLVFQKGMPTALTSTSTPMFQRRALISSKTEKTAVIITSQTSVAAVDTETTRIETTNRRLQDHTTPARSCLVNANNQPLVLVL